MALLTGGDYPARNPVQNIADLKAQIAANEKGVQELRKMVRHFTLPVVRAYMRHVQDNAAESVRRVIDRLHDSSFTSEMDQGTVIKVRIAVDQEETRSDGRLHRHERATADAISMRPSRSRARRCFMSSASWSTTTSR